MVSVTSARMVLGRRPFPHMTMMIRKNPMLSVPFSEVMIKVLCQRHVLIQISIILGGNCTAGEGLGALERLPSESPPSKQISRFALNFEMILFLW